MTEKTKGLTKADLDGYPVPDVSPTLPADAPVMMTPSQAIYMACRALYEPDEVFRKRFTAFDNSTSQTGLVHADRAFAAATAMKYCEENEIFDFSQVENPIAKIVRKWMPHARDRLKVSRQHRLAGAIADGRKAAARQTDEAR